MSTSSSTQTPSIPSHWKVGQTRVVDSAGCIGTLAYAGPVASSKDCNAIYAGIIWDDETRGKHDGSVVSRTTGRLVRHFTAPHPTSASFVPMLKVQTGIALTPKQVLQKYVVTDSDELIAPGQLLPHSMQTAGGREKPVYFLGELQIRSRQQPQHLAVVSLRNMCISFFRPDDWTSDDDHNNNNHKNNHNMVAAWREMDLAGNLLADWSVIADLVNTFPDLTALSLAQNRLGNMRLQQQQQQLPHLPQCLSWLSAPKTSLRKLNLHGTHISDIDTVLQIGWAFPELEELCLAHCDLSTMCVSSSASSSASSASSASASEHEQHQQALAAAFSHLQLLDCSQCGLVESDQVRAWALLPALQRFSLDDNPIQRILLALVDNDDNSNDENNKTVKNDSENNNEDNHASLSLQPFPCLQHLQLAGTQISTWMDVEQLNSLPKVCSLRLRKCPVLAPLGTGEARGLLIARLPALQYLNASPVTVMERLEAEKRYVLQVHRQVMAATAAIATNAPSVQTTTKTSTTSGSSTALGTDSESDQHRHQQQKEQKRLEILSLHPQWERLADKHKQAMSNSLGLTHSSLPGQEHHPHSLADTVLNVTIRSMAASSCTIDPLIRRLPSGLQVGRLKALCARHFGLDMDLQTLHFRMSTDAFPVAMDDDENTLAYYGVSDGADILMNEEDVQQKEKQAEQELVDRMEQQELELNNFQERLKRQGGATISSSVADTGKPHG